MSYELDIRAAKAAIYAMYGQAFMRLCFGLAALIIAGTI